MADARDLKSREGDLVPVRSRSPAPISYRGVEQLVARRAHNPEVVGSSPAPATINPLESDDSSGFLLLFHTLRRLAFQPLCVTQALTHTGPRSGTYTIVPERTFPMVLLTSRIIAEIVKPRRKHK